MPPSSIEHILSQAEGLSADERKALIAALKSEGSGASSPRRSAYGKYAGKLTPVEEFLRRKHEETEIEDRGARS
jgi:hypothetical protein